MLDNEQLIVDIRVNSGFKSLPSPNSPSKNHPQKPTSFSKGTPEVAPGHNTGYSYASIAQIKNAREHCVHVTDHSGW